MTKNEAIKLRSIVEQAAESLTDRTASEAPALFPRLKADGGLIKAGTRINWFGVLKQAVVDLWDTLENNPDSAPDLWSDIAYREGIRIAPKVFTSTNAAKLGELMWFGDTLYRSLMDGNIYTPQQSGCWEKLETKTE